MPRARDDADFTCLMDISGHNPDSALVRRDDAGAVRPDQARGFALQVTLDPHHVHDGDAFGDADNQRDAGVGGFHNGVPGKRPRYEDDGRVRTGLLDGFLHRKKDRDFDVVGVGPIGDARVVGFAFKDFGLSGAARMNGPDNVGTVSDRAVGVKAAKVADALN